MSDDTIIELAGCLIFDEQGRILLLHRSERDEWELPGGRTEGSDEPYEITAARKMFEELNIDVEITETVGATEFTRHDTTYRFHWYKGEILDGSPAPQPISDADDVRFVSREEFVALGNLSPTLEQLIETWPEHE